MIELDFNREIEMAALKAAPLFKACDWQLANAKNGVPTVSEMRAEITALVKDLIAHPEYDAVACGGFNISRSFDGDQEELRISLDLGHLYEGQDYERNTKRQGTEAVSSSNARKITVQTD